MNEAAGTSLDFSKLRRRLALLRVSQARLAALVGVSPSSVSRWLCNERSVSALQLVKLCRVLGSPYFELFDVIEPKTPRQDRPGRPKPNRAPESTR